MAFCPYKCPVDVYCGISENVIREEVITKRKPAVIKGLDVGECTELWTSQYLQNTVTDIPVRVHASSQPHLSFIKKNFEYRTVRLKEVISRASSDSNEEYLYLRALGTDTRGKDVADLQAHFPELAKDFVPPVIFNEESYFSSVLRISSAETRLWTHYDIMDNALVQITGSKRVVLFSPEDALNLYMKNDKSEVEDIDNPDLDRYPDFANVKWYECELHPGDALFIPALWFHNVTALDFSVAVNIFWKHLPNELYDKKDPYGNKDPLPASQSLQFLEKGLKLLEQLPEEYKSFYLKRMIRQIQMKT